MAVGESLAACAARNVRPSGKRAEALIDAIPPTESDSPRCFDSREQWLAWAEAARQVRGEAASPCDDCTARYRSRMREQDRCESQRVRVWFVVGPRGLPALRRMQREGES